MRKKGHVSMWVSENQVPYYEDEGWVKIPGKTRYKGIAPRA